MHTAGTSGAMSAQDERLFEGPGYRRILVPIFGTELDPEQVGERRLRMVANLYSANEASPDF